MGLPTHPHLQAEVGVGQSSLRQPMHDLCSYFKAISGDTRPDRSKDLFGTNPEALSGEGKRGPEDVLSRSTPASMDRSNRMCLRSPKKDRYAIGDSDSYG